MNWSSCERSELENSLKAPAQAQKVSGHRQYVILSGHEPKITYSLYMTESSSSLRDGFAQIGDSLQELKKLIRRHIDTSASEVDMDYVRHVVRSYDQVEKCATVLEELRLVLEGHWQEFGSPVGEKTETTGGFRRMQIEITQGMINQKYISLTEAKKRGLVEIGEKFRIDAGSGSVVETILINPGNKFQNRSFVQEFFDKSQARVGDLLELTEVQKGAWRMSLKRSEVVADELLESLGIHLNGASKEQ